MVKHHIDTSIFLEPQTTEDGRYCRRYLQRVGRNFEGVVSFPVLSEVFATILRIKNYENRHNALDTFDNTFRIRKILFYSPKNIESILNKIVELDSRIDALDREILACAVEDKSDVLVTLDKKLVGNKKLEDSLRIRIFHPKNLL